MGKHNPAPQSDASEQLNTLAQTEKFLLGALHLNASPGRPVEVAFLGHPADAFDDAVLVVRASR